MPIPAGPGLTLPDWAPTLERVAAYVPRRTLVGSVDGYGAAQLLFTDDTYPTATSVTSLIADACNWVLIATGTVDATLTESAASAAALRCAGLVELMYPDNRDDLSDAKTLLDQATAMRKDLAAANIALTSDDPSTDDDNTLPEFVFPAASEAGDLLFW